MKAAKTIQNIENSETAAVSTSVNKCELCGQPLPAQKGKGRPRVFHDDCRKLANILGWTEDLVSSINFTPEQGTKIRRQLWMMGNMIKTSGQSGVKK